MWLPFTMGIFHNGYFDYKGAFQIAVDSYCCVKRTWLKTKCYFTFLIVHFSDDKWGTYVGLFTVVCVGSSHNNYFQKKLMNEFL